MTSPLPYKRALVVANPISGAGRGESVAQELLRALGERGLPTDVHLTRHAGDARETVRHMPKDVDLVVSVGGDGTLREVLSGLRERPADSPDIPVGVLPMGTGNALCADLGLPRDVDRALEVLLAAKTVNVDVANVNGELSFLMTGVGPDALVIEDVDKHRKDGRLSKWSYLPAGIRTFFRHRPQPLTVKLDGVALEGTFSQVMASNLIHYGGLVRLCPERILDDGLFEVFLFRGASRWSLALYTLRFFLHMIPGGSVEMRRARHIVVESAQSVPFHIDGDPGGQTPVDIEVAGPPFQLLVP